MASAARARRPAVFLLTVAVAALAVAACSGTSQHRPAGRVSPVNCQSRLRPGSTRWTKGPAWIISPGALTRLARSGLPQYVLNDFNRPTTLLLSTHDRISKLAPEASIMFYFTNASLMARAIRQDRVPDNVRYLLLDLERWPLTPPAQQQRPIASLRSVLAAARAAGKCVIFTPAVDLVRALHYRGAESAVFSDFNRLIVRPAASLSDVFEVQSQQTEGTRFATELARQAVVTIRAARPWSTVFVGLSTNPNGRRVSPSDLLTVYRAGASAGATGYWLNIPQTSAQCPRCGYPQTQVAVSFLETLARTHWAG